MTKILLIDDDAALGPPLITYLARHQWTLVHAQTPSEGLRFLKQEEFAAVILDVMLPEMNGFVLCRKIREQSSVPILMLSARGEVDDRVNGFENGADDYLPKPFDPRELIVRLEAIQRRHRPEPTDSTEPLVFDGLRIDPIKREVWRDQELVNLTGTEYELLVLLAQKPGQVFSRDEILSHLRGYEIGLLTRAVDILVSRVRRKLEPLRCIQTLRISGYCFSLRPLTDTLKLAADKNE